MKFSIYALLAVLLASAALCTAQEPEPEPEVSAEPEPSPSSEPKAEALGQEEPSPEPESEPEPETAASEQAEEASAEPEPEPESVHESIMPEKQQKAESAGSTATEEPDNGCSGVAASLAVLLSSVAIVTRF